MAENTGTSTGEIVELTFQVPGQHQFWWAVVGRVVSHTPGKGWVIESRTGRRQTLSDEYKVFFRYDEWPKDDVTSGGFDWLGTPEEQSKAFWASGSAPA